MDTRAVVLIPICPLLMTFLADEEQSRPHEVGVEVGWRAGVGAKFAETNAQKYSYQTYFQNEIFLYIQKQISKQMKIQLVCLPSTYKERKIRCESK